MPTARYALADPAADAALAALRVAEAVLAPLAGLAAWLVWQRVDIGLERKRSALRGWGWTMLLGALWPAAADGLHRPALGLAILVLATAAAGRTGLAFGRLHASAPLLLWPFAGWLALTAALAILGFRSGAF